MPLLATGRSIPQMLAAALAARVRDLADVYRRLRACRATGPGGSTGRGIHLAHRCHRDRYRGRVASGRPRSRPGRRTCGIPGCGGSCAARRVDRADGPPLAAQPGRRIGRATASDRRNCNLNLDAGPPRRPDLPCEPQLRARRPRNLHLDRAAPGGPLEPMEAALAVSGELTAAAGELIGQFAAKARAAVLTGRDRPADQGVQAGADRPVRAAAEGAMSAPQTADQ